MADQKTKAFRNFVLKLKKDDFDGLEYDIKYLISCDLLDVTETSLPSLTLAFYERIGTKNKYTESFIHNYLDGISNERASLLYVIYECLPLVTYITKYFDLRETTRHFSRDALTYYMLIRLWQKSRFYDGLCEDFTPPNPFSPYFTDYKTRIQSIKGYPVLNLNEMINMYHSFNLNNANDFLIHVIVLTALVAQEKMDQRSPYHNTKRRWEFKLNEELQTFINTQFPYEPPLSYIRYPVIGIPWVSSVSQSDCTASFTPRTRLVADRSIYGVYPEGWGATELVEILNDINLHDTYEEEMQIQKRIPVIRSDQIENRNEPEGEPTEGVINPPLYYHGSHLMYKYSNEAAYDITLHQYVADKLLKTLVKEEKDIPKSTYQGMRIVRVQNDEGGVWCLCDDDNAEWVLPRSLSDLLGLDILSNEASLKYFVTTCLIILALDLKMNYIETEDRSPIGFEISEKYIAYNPTGHHRNRRHTFNKLGKVNYYGMLCGDNWRTSRSESHWQPTQRTEQVFTPIRAAWLAAADRQYALALFCKKILYLLHINANLLYDICAHQHKKFFKKAKARESREDFLQRVQGLYTASHILLS